MYKIKTSYKSFYFKGKQSLSGDQPAFQQFQRVLESCPYTMEQSKHNV